MKYKEKNLTIKHLSSINIIRKEIDWLRENNIEVHGRQWNLTFFRKENIELASQDKRDITSADGPVLDCETVSIDDSGADDMFYYSKDVIIIK